MKSLKGLAPSFLLVIIYFIVEEFWGPTIGLYAAIALGAIEFITTRIREKIWDKIVLWTTLLFCIPGVLAIYTEDTALSRMQPAMIEVILCILIGFFAFSKIDLTATLPSGYRKEMHFSENQIKTIRRMFRFLFYIICTHTLCSFAALLFLPERIADFISSPLLYILIGSYFLTLFIRNKIIMHKMKKEEWLPIVNEKGEVTGKAPRSVCHSGSKLLHPVVHLHIINQQHEVFLQKRSMKKDLLPGRWDTAVGGHIGVNEKLEDALKRETFEELGITKLEAQFLGSYIWESPRERELVFSFLCKHYDHIQIDNDEVDEGRFWSAQEIKNAVDKDLLTPNFIHEYKLLLSKLPEHNKGGL